MRALALFAAVCVAVPIWVGILYQILFHALAVVGPHLGLLAVGAGCIAASALAAHVISKRLALALADMNRG